MLHDRGRSLAIYEVLNQSQDSELTFWSFSSSSGLARMPHPFALIWPC